jgi:hypothetical protein
MHHHPIDYSYPTHIADISKVEEASELVDWAGKFGIDIILHGHRHHPWAKTCMETGWKNPISFICAGSLSVNAVHRGDVPNTFHVIEFDKSTEPIYLYNYVYSSSRGWEPVKESMPEVRLDARMYLGKAFTENEIEQAIKEFVGKTGEVKWESLPDCLKYLRIEELNDKFRSCLEGNTHIYGKFPNDIYCKGYEVL